MTEPTTGTRRRPPFDDAADLEDVLRAMRLDDASGPATPVDGARAEALVQGAVSAWLSGAPSIPPAVTAASSTTGVRGGVGALALAAGGMALVGVASWLLVSGPAPETPGDDATATVATAQRGAPSASVALPPPAPPLAATAGTSPDPVDLEPAPPAPASLAPEPAPADLLERANALRSERRYAAAARLYDRAARGAGAAMTGYVARVAAASLRLQHLNDPRGAVSRYERALAGTPGGPLDLEIQRGLAEAHRALGDTDAEAAALEALLDRHPRGPAAEEARDRLRVLRR